MQKIGLMDCLVMFFFFFNFAAVIICPIVVGIIMIANSAVIIGLWPAHFIWTLYCVLRYASVLQLSAQVYFLFFPFIHIMFCLLFFFFWDYDSRTKRLGPVLKIVALSVLPVPLILWPIVGIVGSLLGGIGYGFFAPLIATFEAVGVDVTDKCYHCFAVSFCFCFWLCLHLRK